MSARDDYPWQLGIPSSVLAARRHAAMCDEIDRLRSAVTSAVAAGAFRSWELNNEIDSLTADRNRLARIIQRGVHDNQHSGCCSE